MPLRCWSRTGWLLAGGLLGGLLLVRSGSVPSLADQPADGFTPVAPAGAIHAALELNLKITRDWLDGKDFTSAAESAQGLVALTQLYSYQSTQAAWRDQTTALSAAFGKLAAAARARDGAGCQATVRECDTLLAALAKNPPAGARGSETNFKPAGALRQWMHLLDGTYSDAKTSAAADEMANLAYALAEEANAVQYLRGDARWRDSARAVRQAALETAQLAHDGKLAPARQSLKQVYIRCESCHEGHKRKE